MTAPLRIATRASELALRRARSIQAMLADRGIESELVTFRTQGDKQFEEMLPPAALKVIFTKELEAALRRKKVDVAVHSLTDVSTDPMPDLAIAAVPVRSDSRDVMVLNRMLDAATVADLPRGSRIGTSSVRCRSFLRAMFPHLEAVHLRGDLPTRLHKVADGQVHGTIVSAAALQLLEISQHVVLPLHPPEWLPAPAQGAIAVQVREDDTPTRDLIASLDDEATRADVSAERALLSALEGGLQAPVGGLVSRADQCLLRGAIADLEGREILRAELPLDDAQPELAGVRVANELRAIGANRILDALRRAERVPAPQPDA